MSLNNEPYMIRPFLIDLNPVEFKYYPFMSSLDKFSGSCNSADNFKIEANTMVKNSLCNLKCKFNSTICNLNRKCNNETYQCESKHYCTCKKDCSWNLSTCICDNDNYLKRFVFEVNKYLKSNTIATNATSVVSINCHRKKLRYKIDCCNLHTVLLVIILLLIITIIWCHYAKHKPKLKNIFLC